MGVVYHDLNLHQDAILCFEKAISLDSKRSEPWSNKGAALRGCGLFEDSLDCYNKAIFLDEKDSRAWFNRGNTLVDLRRYGDAILSYEKALTLKPDTKFLLGSLVQAQISVCFWPELELRLGMIESALVRGVAASGPFTMLSQFDSPKLHKVAAELYVQESRPTAPRLIKREAGKKIRLGYFSSDFRQHPVSHLVKDLIRSHNRDDFEVSAFSMGPPVMDYMRNYLECAFDQFRDVNLFSDSQIVELARKEQIDIAIDLGGHTYNSRPQIFIDRVAPVQISYLGYPSTWGHRCMDYILADEVVVTDRNRRFFTENVIFLPTCFQSNPNHREVGIELSRTAYGLPERGFIYCCFNNLYKINPHILNLWSRILHAVPQSFLWLSCGEELARKHLVSEFFDRGIDSARLRFAERLPELKDHLARYKVADLFLDTFPYGAHTTASDALWAGLPVLTRAGESYASRVGASLLHAVCMEHLIANSDEEYLCLAIELASDQEKLLRDRAHLERERFRFTLFKVSNLARWVEVGYKRAFHIHQSGKVATDIFIKAEVGT
jgi:predicted O-linked N-acetylglucosamine transferase (SPINDLY family)